MKAIKSCLSKRDKFGTWAKFHYRKESGFGTTFGGLCSLILMTLTGIFAFVQLVGWKYKPTYTQTTQVLYIENADTPYDIDN